MTPERDGPAVVGTVRGRSGTPVPGATVTVTDLDGRQHGRTVSGDDGTYAVPLGTGGTYLVVTRTDGAGPDAGLVAVGASPARHDVTVAGGGTVRGTLTDATGHPVGAAAVTLIDTAGEVVAHTPTDPAGRFLVETPGTGPHTLTATAPGHGPLARTVDADPAAPPVELRFPALAGIAGVARSGDGRPVPGARGSDRRQRRPHRRRDHHRPGRQLRAARAPARTARADRERLGAGRRRGAGGAGGDHAGRGALRRPGPDRRRPDRRPDADGAGTWLSSTDG